MKRGKPRALDELLRRHLKELNQFVQLHLDPQLRPRFDLSDVVQEAQLELVKRMDDYVEKRPMPFRLWQRTKAYERLLNLRRDHVHRKRRSVQQEVRLPDRIRMRFDRIEEAGYR